MFSLQKQQTAINSFTPRMEKHGPENVLAGTLKCETTMHNSVLDLFDKGFKKLLYRKPAPGEQTELPLEVSDGLTSRKLPQLKPLVWDEDFPGYKIEIQSGLALDEVLKLDVAEIHGITTERAMDEGRPEAEVLAEFLELHARCALRVAHNEDFDQRIVRIAIKRFGAGATQEERDAIADAFKAAPKYCTMKSDAKARGVKWPKLVEAYKHHTGKDLGEDAHSALFDAQACAEVYFAMNPVAVPV